MEVVFTDTFFKSLKKLARHNTWWYKIWEAIRYDVPNFFKNIYKFRKELYNYHDWDSMHALNMFSKAIEQQANYLEKHGNEIEDSRNKKIAKMRRAVQIMHMHINDDFIQMAEDQLGYKVNVDYWFDDKIPANDDEITKKQEELAIINEKNSVVYSLASKLENDTWDELMIILHGQNINDYDKSVEWDMFFDGSGMKYWWD